MLLSGLVLEYDIVIEQFRPGVMAKLGLDYETLSKINPKLIYCSITVYGQTGPVLAGTQIADIAGGSHHAVMSLMAAVIARQSSEQGQWLDVSMTDAGFSLNALFGAGALASGQSPQLSGTLLNGAVVRNLMSIVLLLKRA